MTETDQGIKTLLIARNFTKAVLATKEADFCWKDMDGRDRADNEIMLSKLDRLEEEYGVDCMNRTDYTDLSFVAAEYLLAEYSRYCSDETIAALLPVGAQDANVAAAFAARGASGMAKICTPKP